MSDSVGPCPFPLVKIRVHLEVVLRERRLALEVSARTNSGFQSFKTTFRGFCWLNGRRF